MAPGENLELACLQFEYHGACYPCFLSRSRPNLFRKSADHWFRFCYGYILLESVLSGDGFGRPVRDNFAIVDTACEFMQSQAKAAELLLQKR